MLEKIDARLEEARSHGRPLGLRELEALYTSGCAQILELEADSLRTERQLKELRERLRHIRTAIEFLQQKEQGAGDSAR
jgi:hypothetical protein